MNRREYLLAAASALTLISVRGGKVAAATPEQSPANPEFSPEIHLYVPIPMRDGTVLNGSLYLPRGVKAPRPTIFAFGPYSADHYHTEGVSLSSNGYPFLSVDMRGRGDSGGEFSPFVTESGDAHDLVEWIIKQPFCNGKVGTLGLSYYGYTQWGAVRGNARLTTIVPSAPCYVGFDFPLRYNIFFNFAATFLTRVSGHTSRLTAYGDGQFWQAEFLRFLESGLPFRKMAEFFGLPAKPFDDWMQHPMQDAYWDQANPTPEQFANLTIPILSMCGVYDGDQPGTLEFHRQHLKYAGAKANHYLVIGPWGHLEVRKPKSEYFGIKVGPESVIDMPKLHRDWYAWTMEGGERPDFLKKKITYYVMVADEWRYADKLEDVTSHYEPLYLDSARNAGSLYSSGSLGPRPKGRSEPDHYVYDPRDLSTPRLEMQATQSHLLDQTMVMARSEDKLIYHSEPFDRDQEVTGFFKLDAWVGIDTPDTDFIVQIYAISPDGSSVFLTEQQMRARYRESLRTEKLVNTKAPLLYRFDRFFFISRLVRKGHHLRMVFRANHGLAWQKNYNSGKPVADETMADARTVTVRLFHDAAHPSVLHVPIGRSNT